MAGIKTLGFAVDDHDPRSWELYRFLDDMDYKHGDRYLGRLDPGWLKADPDGKSNFWGGLVAPSDWRLSGWSYFRDPDVRYWTPLPKAPTKEES